MVRWLYNSEGEAIANITGSSVFNLRGDFIGKLYDDNQIWNGEYIGEILHDDRLLFNPQRAYGRRSLPGMPCLPGFAGEPRAKEPVMLPTGYHDVDRI